jgi:AAA ATPase-like protein
VAEVASVLVGRREELAALDRALGDVERGDARAVGVRGEPGIGKSRLLWELAARARERGVLVLAGRAAELERDLPFAPLADALEPLLREQERAGHLAELAPEELGELAAVLPAVGPLAKVAPAPASGERHRLARAVRALLRPLSRITRPYARGRTEPPRPGFSSPEQRQLSPLAARSPFPTRARALDRG